MSDEKRTDRDDWTDEPTGEGGVTGAPTSMEGVPDSANVGVQEVVSGGGVVDRDDLDPEDRAASTTDLD